MVRLRRRFIYGVIAVFVVLLSAGGGLGYSLWLQVQQEGGLTNYLQNNLNSRSKGVFSTIDEAKLEFRLAAAPIRLKAENIRLNAADTSLVLPRSEFGFSLFNLLSGRMVPSEMSISGLEIEIEHGARGWHAGPSVALITTLLRETQNAATSDSTLATLRKIYIGNAKLKISQPKQVSENAREWVVIEPIAITLNHRNKRLEGNIAAEDPTGGKVSVDFTSNEKGTDMNLVATVSGLQVASIYPYLGINIPEISEFGSIEGRLAFSIRDRMIESLSGDMMSKSGTMLIPGYGRLDYDEAAMIFAHDSEHDLLTISNIDILSRQPESQVPSRLLVSGQIKNFSTDSPVVFTKIKGSNLPVEDALRVWPESAEPELRALVDRSVQGGSIASLGIDTVGVVNRRDRLFQVTTLDLVTEMRALRLETGFASVERLVGTLSSRLELSIGNNGAIEHAAADFLLTDALLLPKNSSRLIDLEGIELRTKLAGNTLEITRAAVDARHLGQMAMIAEVEIERDWHPHRLDLKVKAEQIDKALLTELWPEQIRPQTRAWVNDRIKGGIINGLAINGGFDLPRDGSARIIYLNGKADLVDSELAYLETMPPMKDTRASISFEGKTLRADFASGTVEGLDLAGSRFIIRPTEAGPEADLALLAKGDFGGAVRLLDHERLNLLDPAGTDITEASGHVDVTMGMKWIIPTGDQSIEDTGGTEINLSASVEDAALNGLPYGMQFTDATLDIIYSPRSLMINGRGLLDGSPTVLTLERMADGAVDLDLAVARSPQLTRWIADRVPVEIGGETGALVQLKGAGGMDDLVLDARLDLDNTSINIQRLGLVKLPGEKASLDARFQIEDGQVGSISDITLESDVLTASGHLSFAETGRFLGAYFDSLAWPGNDLSNITMERNAEGNLRITAEAGLIDLTPLRREESPGEGIPLEIELTANRIILDDYVSLAGNVMLTTDSKGVGEAQFFGGLFLANEPFMTEASLKAMFGSGHDHMEGRGLIGGSEASISLSPSEAGGSLMVLRSNNAGQVLKTLNIIDGIRSGKLYMVTEFHPELKGHYDVNFELEDFNVIEAPKAVRVMSVLSVAGLYSLLEGDGTNFRLGHAHVEISPEKQIIHQARATGSAVAVDLVGVIDPVRRELEVSGTLLPLYGLTKLIGALPIISELLTGVDNSGVFATQFSITGSIDDPQNSVNLSSIAPGFIRDIFSPDWVRRERQRLITDQQPDNATQ